MPQYLAKASGDWSDSSTWARIANTPSAHATSTVSVTTGSFSDTWTAPNTTDQVTHLAFNITAIPTSRTLTFTLQENTVDKSCTVVIDVSTLTGGPGWYSFEVSSPYTYATTSAGAYRWKCVCSAGAASLAANAAGTNFQYKVADTRTGVPTFNVDDASIFGSTVGFAPVVALTGTSQGVGTDADTLTTTSSTSLRTATAALTIGGGGTLSVDTSASTKLAIKGKIGVSSGGKILDATSGSPLSSSYTSEFEFTNTSGNVGLYCIGTYTLQLHGRTLPNQQTTFVSGLGTAASPLQLAADLGLAVNDPIAISATSDTATNYNETEYRFIRSINSATSVTLSATAGGAESGLSNTHTTSSIILNRSCNLIFTNTDLTRTAYILLGTTPSTNNGNVDVDWVRFNGFGVSIGDYVNIDYCTAYSETTLTIAGFNFTSISSQRTFTNLAVSRYASSSSGALAGMAFSSARNITLNNPLIMNTLGHGMYFTSSYGININNLNLHGTSTGAAASRWALIGLNSGNITFTGASIQSGRAGGFQPSGMTVTRFVNSDFGTKGKIAGSLIDPASSTYNTVVFENSLFDDGSATFVNAYTSMVTGSELAFQKYNQTDNYHFWYTPFGIAGSAGTGLTNTTVRTSGSLSCYLAPEDATSGFEWDFNINARANSVITFTGYAYKNAAFGSDVCRIELWLPGATSASSSQTLTNTTDAWQAITLSAENSEDVSGLASIKVFAISSAVGAKVFFDDFYNAGNALTTTTDAVTGLDVWKDGKPTGVMTPLVLSAADIWGTDLDPFNTSGMAGLKLKSLRNPSIILSEKLIQ